MSGGQCCRGGGVTVEILSGIEEHQEKKKNSIFVHTTPIHFFPQKSGETFLSREDWGAVGSHADKRVLLHT